MRDYIHKNIKEPIRLFSSATRKVAEEDFDHASVKGSSIHGQVTDRTAARDCFIFGTVIMHGNCKMVGCTVAKHITLIVEDGAVISNCAIGHAHDCHKPVPMTITIGRNATLVSCELNTNIKIGKGSLVFGSRVVDDWCNEDADAAKAKKFVHIGSDCALINTELILDHMDKLGEDHTVTIGNHAVLFHNRLIPKSEELIIGDEFVFGGMEQLLQVCCDPQNIPTLTIGAEEHPACSSTRLQARLRNLQPVFRPYTNMYIGNRMLLTVSLCTFSAHANKTPGACSISIGDDVIVGMPGRMPKQPEHTSSSTGSLKLSVDKMAIDDGCTLMVLGAGLQSSDDEDYGKYYMSLTFGEHSTVVFSRGSVRALGASPLAVKVRPYSLAQL